MLFRATLIPALSGLLALSAIYRSTVQRGAIAARELPAWEVAATGDIPFRTRTFDLDERQPQYPRSLRWLAPALSDIHAVDVHLRWNYWHEQELPEFDDAPDLAQLK